MSTTSPVSSARGPIVTAIEDDPGDANFAPLQENLRRLESMTDGHGRPLEIVPIPMPPPVVYEGQRLPASYANFYIANRVVLLADLQPSERRTGPHDAGEAFPQREVIGLDCTDLIWGLGAFHCLTQQVPAVESAVR